MSFSSSSSSFLPLFFTPPFHKPRNLFTSITFPSSSRSLTLKSILCFASDSSHSQFDRQEALWLREEQRWLREEQRWLREEQRWLLERDELLRRIDELERRIQALEGSEVSENVARIAGLLQALKDKSLIAESGSAQSPMVLEEKKSAEEEEREKEVVVVEKVVRVSEGEAAEMVVKKRSALRMGSEGEEVRAMQEALGKLGFYSGEEDIEYSSFSTGTERAVKTWQASLGAREDGIMTEELLEILFTTQIQGAEPKEGANGAAISSVTEISNVKKTVVKDDGVTGAEVSKHRVFLLGENRWEEPSRLRGTDKKAGDPGKSKTKESATKCLVCRGEGRLMCIECDGTGEPNIEPQFLEWVDEGAKCPYCEGLGYTICDVCEGKTVV